MRQITAAILIISICYQAFYNLGVMTYWMANRAYIAAYECENRDKPAMKCDGKCYLKKKMIDAPQPVSDTKSAPASPQLKKGIEWAVFEMERHSVLIAHEEVEESNRIPAGVWLYSSRSCSDIFHPPQSGC